jgi:hypothetical protein
MRRAVSAVEAGAGATDCALIEGKRVDLFEPTGSLEKKDSESTFGSTDLPMLEACVERAEGVSDGSAKQSSEESTTDDDSETTGTRSITPHLYKQRTAPLEECTLPFKIKAHLKRSRSEIIQKESTIGDSVNSRTLSRRKIEVAQPMEHQESQVRSQTLCRYGEKCYSKNPIHFTRFYHPHLDHMKSVQH